jgi:hypothetical protein
MPYSIPDDIADRVRRLRPAAQAKALAFVRQLEAASNGRAPGETLRRFVGTIAPEDLRLISAAVEADCERIDVTGW